MGLSSTISKKTIIPFSSFNAQSIEERRQRAMTRRGSATRGGRQGTRGGGETEVEDNKIFSISHTKFVMIE